MTKFRDLLERTASTYVVALLGLMIAGGMFDASGQVHLDFATKAAIAAVPAGLAVIVNAIRLWLAAPPKTQAGDVLLRTLLTWGETFGGLLLASNVFDIGAKGGVKAIVAMGVASIPAALTFLKANVASLFGKKGSGSLDPTVDLAEPLPWAA